MGPHLGGPPATAAVTAEAALWARLNGVFWAAFLLFSWTAASIVSGAVIERVRSWRLLAGRGDARLGHLDHRCRLGLALDGWMVKLLGYHDAYASGVIHAIAGGTALGVLVHLGPRIGKFRADGTPRNIVPPNPWLVTIGLFLIYAGFWGFYVACNVPIIGAERHRREGRRLHGDHDLPDADHALGDHRQFPDVALGRAAGRLHGLQGRRVLDLFVPGWPASSRARPATTSTIRSRR